MGTGRARKDSQSVQTGTGRNPFASRAVCRKPNQHFCNEVSSLSPGLTVAAGSCKVVKPHYWKVHPVRFPLRAGGCVRK